MLQRQKHWNPKVAAFETDRAGTAMARQGEK
jgi:hypothetical protein